MYGIERMTADHAEDISMSKYYEDKFSPKRNSAQNKNNNK